MPEVREGAAPDPRPGRGGGEGRWRGGGGGRGGRAYGVRVGRRRRPRAHAPAAHVPQPFLPGAGGQALQPGDVEARLRRAVLLSIPIERRRRRGGGAPHERERAGRGRHGRRVPLRGPPLPVLLQDVRRRQPRGAGGGLPGRRRIGPEGGPTPRLRRVPLAVRDDASPGSANVLPRRELAGQGRGLPRLRDVLRGVPRRVRAGATDAVREVDGAAYGPE